MNPTHSKEHWDALHSQPRFRPRYPNEHAVRFIMSHFKPGASPPPSIIDIGVGGGRHTRLLCELGFRTTGTDISAEGIAQTRAMLAAAGYMADLVEAPMWSLPLPDNQFDGALSFGVYYYGDGAAMEQSVGEMHRILKCGGVGFVVLRTTDDYRFGKGELIEPNTFRIMISDTNEQNTTQHFVAESAIPALFCRFSSVDYEKAETTFNNRSAVNSDWLITVKK